MSVINRRHLLLIVVAVVLGLTGCSKDHLDPTQIGRFRPAPVENVILDSLGVAEETADVYEGAEDPKPDDVLGGEQDYMFSSGDVIRIAIFELLQEGVPYVDYFVVSESGNISVPEIGQIQAAGLTEAQLEDEIKNSLSPGILKNPSVAVSLQDSASKVFTIIGDGVRTPGRYSIPRYDFRLLDALAVAGSAQQFNVSYIYVARQLTGQDQSVDELGAEDTANLEFVEPGREVKNAEGNAAFPQDEENEEMLDLLRPVFSTADSSEFVMASAEMVTEEQLKALAVPETQQDKIEWIFRDGKWVPLRVDDNKPQEPRQQVDIKPQLNPQPLRPKEESRETKPEVEETPLKDYGWEDIQSAGIGTRVIRIPKDRLYGGDPRYNIIIKPQDTITVQLDIVGEFYVLGNVNYQGVINMTGRPMTLKMAIASAGGLGQLAWPKKCEVIRRIGEKKEEIVMVDLEKIANGTQPDFFIKPNDVINVGTHGISRYLLGLRNAFTAYYGFGFMYERNFADRDVYTHRPIPVDWFGL